WLRRDGACQGEQRHDAPGDGRFHKRHAATNISMCNRRHRRSFRGPCAGRVLATLRRMRRRLPRAWRMVTREERPARTLAVRVVRDEVKYGKVIAFARALPRIRQRVAADLRRSGLPREKVLAAVVQLLEKTLIRVGNEEYARHNHSFGLTTMRDQHAKVHGSTVRFEFRGKSGIEHAIDLHDARLARIVKACRDLPGYELFQCVDENGKRQIVDSADVNAYLRELTGRDFTAKDFRTWAGTVMAAAAL